MKKLVLTAATAFLLLAGAVACTSKTEKEVESASTFKTVIENCTNTDSLKMYVQKAEAYAQKLVAEGKLDEARKYLDEIEPIVKDKVPALASTFATVNSALGKAEAVFAEERAKEATDSLKEAAADAARDASEKAADAVDAAKEKVGEAADAAKQKASDAANEAKEKAANAVADGADKLKDALTK